MVYECPYCGFTTDNLMIYLLHISEHPEWWDDNSLCEKVDDQSGSEAIDLSFSLNKGCDSSI